MTTGILHTYIPDRVIDSNGIADGASLAFYVTNTLTKATIYSDAGLTTPLANPVVVGAGAEVPDIYLDPAVIYRRIITYSNGSTKDTDPWADPYISAAELASTAAGKGLSLSGTPDGISAQEEINRDQHGISRSASMAAYDDFRQTNGALDGKVAPSGHVWTAAGTDASAVIIQDGKVYSPTKGTWYGKLNMGAQVNACFFQFQFDSTGLTPTNTGEKSDRVALASYDRSANFPDNLSGHLNIGLEKWSFYPRKAGVVQYTDDNGLLTDGALNLLPGVVYMAGFIQSGSTFTIYLPGKDPITRTFANSASFTADGAYIECIPAGLASDNYAALGRIVGVDIGGPRTKFLPALSQGAPSKEIGPLRGDNLLTTKPAQQFVASTNGWYTIYETNFRGVGFSCAGVISLSCVAANGGFEKVEYAVLAWTNGSSYQVSLARNDNRRVYRGTPLSQVRASTDGVSKAIIEIYLPTAATSNVTVDRRSEGYFSPVITPVAVADPGSSLTYASTDTLPTTAALTSTSFTVLSAAQGDWFRVGIGNGWASFAFDAELLIVAKSANGAYVSVWKLLAGARYNQNVFLKEIYGHHTATGGAVTQARVSRDSGTASNSGVALDLYIPSRSSDITVTIYPTSSGANNLAWVSPPTSGASALATESVTLSCGQAQVPEGVTTNGDAAATLRVLGAGATGNVTKRTQVWNTPLTANRTVTLSTTYAAEGNEFEIIRTAAATGAFNLNVGTGPLKALGVGSWCRVKFDGTAWFLAAYGTL